MAIVIILANKAHFIGLQSWLKLLCVNYHIALGFCRRCCLLFPPFRVSPSCFRRLSSPATLFFSRRGPLCSRLWDFVCFKSMLPLSPIITSQTEICIKKKTPRLSEEEGGRGGVEGGGGMHRGTERNVTAEAQRVGGECRRGQDLELAAPFLSSLSPLIRKCQSGCTSKASPHQS